MYASYSIRNMRGRATHRTRSLSYLLGFLFSTKIYCRSLCSEFAYAILRLASPALPHSRPYPPSTSSCPGHCERFWLSPRKAHHPLPAQTGWSGKASELLYNPIDVVDEGWPGGWLIRWSASSAASAKLDQPPLSSSERIRRFCCPKLHATVRSPSRK